MRVPLKVLLKVILKVFVSYFERLNPKLSGILDLVQLEVQYKTTEQNPIQRLYLFLISLILY